MSAAILEGIVEVAHLAEAVHGMYEGGKAVQEGPRAVAQFGDRHLQKGVENVFPAMALPRLANEVRHGGQPPHEAGPIEQLFDGLF